MPTRMCIPIDDLSPAGLAIADLSDEFTRPFRYREKLTDVGRALGGSYASSYCLRGKDVFVLALAEELDTLCVGFLEGLSGAGIEAQIGCFWVNSVSLHGFDEPLSRISQEYRDDIDGPIDVLIVLSAAAGDSSAITTCIRRMLHDTGPEMVDVVTPLEFHFDDDIAALCREYHLDDIRHFSLSNSKFQTRLGSPLLGSWRDVCQRCGVDPNGNERYRWPDLIRDRIPRPDPDIARRFEL